MLQQGSQTHETLIFLIYFEISQKSLELFIHPSYNLPLYPHLIPSILPIHKLLSILEQFEHHNSNLLHSNLP